MHSKSLSSPRYSPVPFAVCVCVLTLLTAVLVRLQLDAGTQYEIYVSDMPFHLNFVLNGAQVQYSLFHLFLSLLLPITGPQGLSWVMTILLALCNGVSLVLTRIFIVEQNAFCSTQVDTRLRADFLSCSLFFVSMLIPRLPGYYLYLAAWSPNPWHNPTYWFCRPFAILSFLFMARFKSESDAGNVHARTLIALGLSTLVSAFAKPSFFLVFIPACFVYFLVDLVVRRFRPFGRYLLLALALLPSALALLWQNQILFVSDASSGIVIAPGAVWNMYTLCLPLSILFGVAFPLYVVIWLLVTRRFRQAGFPLHISLVTYLFAFAELYFLAETGPRAEDANFAWGYCFSLFFLFLSCANIFFLQNRPKGAAGVAGKILFLLHLGFGIGYLIYLLAGGGFH